MWTTVITVISRRFMMRCDHLFMKARHYRILVCLLTTGMYIFSSPTYADPNLSPRPPIKAIHNHSQSSLDDVIKNLNKAPNVIKHVYECDPEFMFIRCGVKTNDKRNEFNTVETQDQSVNKFSIKSQFLVILLVLLILLPTIWLFWRGRSAPRSRAATSLEELQSQLLRDQLKRLETLPSFSSPLKDPSYEQFQHALSVGDISLLQTSQFALFSYICKLKGKNKLYRSLESLMRFEQTFFHLASDEESALYFISLLPHRYQNINLDSLHHEAHMCLQLSERLHTLDAKERIEELNRLSLIFSPDRSSTESPSTKSLRESPDESQGSLRSLALELWSLSYQPLLQEGQSLKLSTPQLPCHRSDLKSEARYQGMGQLVIKANAPHLTLHQGSQLLFSSPHELMLG